MLRYGQGVILAGLGIVFWAAALAWVRAIPMALTDPAWNILNFAGAVSVAWTCVLLIRRVAGLAPDQLMAGMGLVGAVAMTLDGAVLNWAPRMYGPDDTVTRLAAGWLLWGYGLSLAIALAMARAGRRRPSAATPSGDGVTPP
ncbi:hypothetical protein [Nitrospirillum iridis]|uniref:Uncharacterized protein n=1 Tax=Nitrospirillum iridis TaxID=765888 RepID=A0A7X0AVM1_9PROT|nr:hypothetical protein [Nitrospirillum iridis]MBB6250954.1 hypothetical protein [Nitrospirillum iridis]